MSRRTGRSRSQGSNKKGVDPTVLVALIGAISAILIALVNSEKIVGWFIPSTSTPVVETSPISSATNTTASLTVTLPGTNTVETTVIPTLTSTMTASPSLTETPSLFIGMHVRLYADRTTGKAPLRVRLDARDSFLRAPGGVIYGCKSGACVYTWEVYSGGQRIGKPAENSSGTFQYTFRKRGLYFITVVVCRGGGSADCNGSGAQFDVK
jgi:hypothetical protein